MPGYVKSSIAHKPEDDGRLDQAQKHHRGSVRGNVGADLPLIPAFGDDPRDLLQIPLKSLVNSLFSSGAAGEDLLGKEHSGYTRMMADQLDMSHQQKMKAFQRIGCRLTNRFDIGQQAPGNQIEHRLQHAVFTRVMPVNGRRQTPTSRDNAPMFR